MNVKKGYGFDEIWGVMRPYYDKTELSLMQDETIVNKLNEIDQKKCRFGADIKALEDRAELLIGELKSRGYKIKNIDIN